MMRKNAAISNKQGTAIRLLSSQCKRALMLGERLTTYQASIFLRSKSSINALGSE